MTDLIANGESGASVRAKLNNVSRVQRLKRLTVKPSIKKVMGTPATITAQTSAFSGYSKAYPTDNSVVPTWTPVVDFYGGFRTLNGTRIRPRAATSNPTLATNPLASAGFDDIMSVAAFWSEDSAPVIRVDTNTTVPFRFKVNGEYVSLTGTAAAATGDSYLKIDFSGSGVALPALVEVEGSLGWSLRNVLVRPTYAVFAPRNSAPKGVVIADSFGAGPITTQYDTPPPIPQDGWVRCFSEYLSCPDIWSASQGGTGWVGANGTRPAFKDRAYDALNLMPDGVTPRSDWYPDFIIATGGLNDVAAGTSTATVQAAVLQFYNYIRARDATIPLLIGGVHWRPIGSIIPTQAMEAAIRATVETLQVTDPYLGFIPISENTATQWVFGTGYQGATNDSGNSDLLAGTDGVHPSYAGHQTIGLNYAREALRLFSAMPG